MLEIPVLNASPTDTGPGRKFSASGAPQLFQGNTVLCHLTAPAAQAARALVEQLRAAHDGGEITWLPPASHHVTLFDGALDTRRALPDWPQGLALDAPLAECHALMGDRLRGFDLGIDLPLRFVVDETVTSPTLTAVPLRPADAQQAQQLGDLRDRLARATGVRHANHDSYNFHITFGYYVQAFDLAELSSYRAAVLAAVQRFRRRVPVIELGAPEYCVFDDMTAFQTQFRLEPRP